jgi:glycosyltransferase involved in cell wall biosynthesis
MRLLCVYYTHKPGGLCRRLYRLLGAAARAGHEVHYLALDQPPAECSAEVHFHRIPFALKARRGAFFWLTFSLWLPLWLAIVSARLRPQRLVAFDAFYAGALTLARLATRARIVFFMRARPSDISRVTGKGAITISAHRVIERLALFISSTIVCTTDAMRSEIAADAAVQAKCTVLPNDLPQKSGVSGSIFEYARQAFKDSATRVVLTSGVLDVRKNIGVLLEAWSALARGEAARDAVLMIAGEGPLRKDLEARAAALSLNNVSFMGWRNDLASHLGGVTLVVHPAFHEGMSNSILEALSAGVPVLASNTPENRELLASPDLLFSPVDSAALAAKLSEALSDEAKLRALARQCDAAAARLRFDWTEAALKIIAVGISLAR